MLPPANFHPTLKPAYRRSEERSEQLHLPASLLPVNFAPNSSSEIASTLPLATPEDSDIDSSSAISTKDNTDGESNQPSSTNTVLRVSGPLSSPTQTVAVDPNTARSSTTLSGAPSMSSFVLPSHYRGASFGRRSTFPRMDSGQIKGGFGASFQSMRVHRVKLLDEQILEIPLKKSATGADLFREVCQALNLQERDFFGLYFYKHGGADAIAHLSTTTSRPFRLTGGPTPRRMPWQVDSAEACAVHHRGVSFWLKMDRKIGDQCKKNSWFWFGVRIYPSNPSEGSLDELTRYLLCLQLRQDLICGRLACSFFTHAMLAAYWVQSELGDWDLYQKCCSASEDGSGGTDYLNAMRLASPAGADVIAAEREWMTSRTGPPQPPPLVHTSPSFLRQVALFHRFLKGIVPSQADSLFLQTAGKLATYGIDFHRFHSSGSSTAHLNAAGNLSGDLENRRNFVRGSGLSQSMRHKTSTKSSTLMNRFSRTRLSLSPSTAVTRVNSHVAPTSANTGLDGVQSPSSLSATRHQYPNFLGVFYGGIYVYRGRLRLEHHPWSAIVKMAYRRASFRLCLRLANSEKDGLVQIVKFDCGTTALAKRIYRSCVDHHALFRLHGFNGRLNGPNEFCTPNESFPFPTATRLRRLHVGPLPNSCSSRLNTVAICTPASMEECCTVSVATNGTTFVPNQSSTPLANRHRPRSVPDIRGNLNAPSTPGRQIALFRSAQKFFSRLLRRPSVRQKGHKSISKVVWRSRLQPSLSEEMITQREEVTDLSLMRTGESTSSCAVLSTAASTSPLPLCVYSEWNRPPLPGPIWRLSSVDASPGLSLDTSSGLTVSRDWRFLVNRGENGIPNEWRGCRSAWGVVENVPLAADESAAAPACFAQRRFFFEVRLNGCGPVRIGWATEDASLVLGEDERGFAYQTDTPLPAMNDDSGCDGCLKTAPAETKSENELLSGTLIIGGACVATVFGSCKGDVIGCYLDLDSRLAHWTKNGSASVNMSLPITQFPPKTVFFPACAIRNTSVTFNFGDAPFAYGPMLPTGSQFSSSWLPLASANLVAEVVGCADNRIVGSVLFPIRLIPNPRTSCILVQQSEPGCPSNGSLLSADRLCARARLHAGWQSLYASSSIPPPADVTSQQHQLPCVYFEVRILESLNIPGSGVFVGFSTGRPIHNVDKDATSFGIIFEQGSNMGTSLLHAGVKRPYGRALRQGDVIGCILNLQSGLVVWASNGEHLGHIVQLFTSPSQLPGSENTAALADDVILIPPQPDERCFNFCPVFSLCNTSIEVNFGDGSSPLKYIDKHSNCIPLCQYQRMLEDSTFSSNTLHQPLKGSVKSHRHHSFAQYRMATNQNSVNGHQPAVTTAGVHKSASCLSALATSSATVNSHACTEALDSQALLRAKIPLVPVKTHTWRLNSAPTDNGIVRLITSPTIPAPWSPVDQVLPIVRTHRITFSGIRPVEQMETGDDADGTSGSLRRSASDSVQCVTTPRCPPVMAVIQHLCGQSQQSCSSAANKSSSSSLIESLSVNDAGVELPLAKGTIENAESGACYSGKRALIGCFIP
uniref:FERM domain-containing protein n=2 Tax=Mesocestoides corti TaxID=53468 RepID=A0A5K3F6W6_MESCO